MLASLKNKIMFVTNNYKNIEMCLFSIDNQNSKGF